MLLTLAGGMNASAALLKVATGTDAWYTAVNFNSNRAV